MNFVSIRIITADIKRLARFYEQITGIPATMYTEDFGELKTAGMHPGNWQHAHVAAVRRRRGPSR